MDAPVWSRDQAIATVDPVAIDDLAEAGVLVLDGVSAADDRALAWCRRAPCVVIATPTAEPSTAVDVISTTTADVDRMTARVIAHAHAARTLVTVLRTSDGLDVDAALNVESLAYSMLLRGEEFDRWLREHVTPSARIFDRPPLRVERDGDEVGITLTRPENCNAFSAAMRDALFDALTFVELDDTVAGVTLQGEGPCFSSGGDLAEFGTATDIVVAHETRTRHSVGAIIARLASRITARVHGPCVGAGVELSAFAGRVVAGPDTTFRLPEVDMGLIPGAGGTVSVARRIGRQATARFALLGDAIDAATALQLGLIDEIAP